MGISRRCASKWWHRYLELGVDGLHDRSSRPRRSPRRVTERVEAKICIGYAYLHNAIDDYSRRTYTKSGIGGPHLRRVLAAD